MRCPAKQEQVPLSRGRLVWRVGATLALSALAVTAAASSIGRVTATINPAIAMSVDRDNGRASAALADRLIVTSGKDIPWDRIEALARRSLESTPMNARAVRQLGMVAEARGDSVKALRLVRLAIDVSPRELWGNIWLVQNCAVRDDLNCAMRHFDVAMRGNAGSRQLLFPIMQQVLTKPALQQAIVPFIKTPAPWMENFIRHVAVTPNVVDIAAAVGRAGGLPAGKLNDDAETLIVEQLIFQREFAAAQRFLTAVSPQRREQLKQVALTAASVDERAAPLSWALTSNPRSQTFVDKRPGSSALALRVETAPGDFAVMAQKIIFRDKGRYRFSAGMTADAFSAAASGRWMMACMAKTSETPLWSKPIQADRATVVDFEIPAGCPTQALRLVVSGGDGNDGAEFYVDRLALEPRP